MNNEKTWQKVVRLVVALAIGFALAIYVYQRVTDPQPGLQRAQEERIVNQSREILQSYVAPAGDVEIVDPLAANRKIGKVYVFAAGDGWEVSGFYRRHGTDIWHPYLMSLDAAGDVSGLTVSDRSKRLIDLAAQDEALTVLP